MARIRSIHPAIWTDEDFASLSMASRVLLIGIWTEADDHGVFEWKPVSLKMRIFPADKIDMEPLLRELGSALKIEFFQHEGRDYGAVRNFCKFQRPKKPTYRYFLPDDLRTYIGLTADGSVPVPHQYGTGTEVGSQMKEEGGNKKNTADAVSTGKAYAFESGVIRLTQKDFDRWKASFTHLDLGAELESLSGWAEQQGPKWFHPVANALAKRNREIGLKIEQQKTAPAFKWNGIEGVV